MPAVPTEVVLFGEDPGLAQWLAERGIRAQALGGEQTAREVVLASGAPPQDPAAWAELARHMARGSTVIFLQPGVLQRGDNPVGWLPLESKGRFVHIGGWLYLADEWAKNHAIFEGLPSGGLMDYTYYREIIPNTVFADLEAPAEAVAGSMKTSQDYASGLLVAVYSCGAGRFVLNALYVRESLGSHPAAERLLRNLLNWAAQGSGEAPAALPSTFGEQLARIGYR
jgi:hypothetical protein